MPHLIERLRDSNLYNKGAIVGFLGRGGFVGMLLLPFYGYWRRSILIAWASKMPLCQRDGDTLSCEIQGHHATGGDGFFYMATTLSSFALFTMSLGAETYLVSRHEPIYQSIRGLKRSTDNNLIPNLDSRYGRAVNALRKRGVLDSLNLGFFLSWILLFLPILVHGCSSSHLIEQTGMPTVDPDDTSERWRRVSYDLQCVDNQGLYATLGAAFFSVFTAVLLQAVARWRNRSNQSTAGFQRIASIEDAEADNPGHGL